MSMMLVDFDCAGMARVTVQKHADDGHNIFMTGRFENTYPLLLRRPRNDHDHRRYLKDDDVQTRHDTMLNSSVAALLD